MNALERYIFRKIVVSGLGGALAIFAVVWVSQAVTRIDFATGSGQGILAFLALLSAISPQLIAIALPFGMLIGMVQVLNGLNSNSELSVMAGSGVSRWSIAKPFFIFGMLASFYTLFSAHFIEPYSNRAKRELIVEARAQLLNTVIVPGQFRNLEKGMTIYIDGKDGEVLQGLMLADRRDPNNELIHYAQVAQLSKIDDEDILLLGEGQVHRREAADRAASIVSFDTYAVSLAEFTGSDGTPTYKVVERPTSELLSPDPNDGYAQSRILEFNGEYHRRYSDWLYPFLFSLVALVCAGQVASHRQSNFSALGLAFLAALGYRGTAYFVYGESGGTRMTFWFYAIPIGGMLVSLAMYHLEIKPAVPAWLNPKNAYKAARSGLRARLSTNSVARA